jgi:PadR family transcriptional regulator
VGEINHHVGEFEQLTLLSVLQLGEKAYGIQIRRHLEREGARRVSRGALYKTLERLVDKGLMVWEVSDSTPERGGLPRRRFAVTPAGVAVLRHSKETLVRMWAGLESVLG